QRLHASVIYEHPINSKKKRQHRDGEPRERSPRRGVSSVEQQHRLVASESTLRQAEKRELRAARVDVFETLRRLQRRSAGGEHNVFRERRTVFHTDGSVFADGVMNGRLK